MAGQEFFELWSNARQAIFSLTDSDWLDWLWALGNFELYLQIILVLLLLLVGRYIYDLATPFSLSEVLTTRDNKALSLSFAAYLVGLAIVIIGVYSSDSLLDTTALPYWRILLYHLSDTFLWGIAAICLLLLAQVCNNRFILSKFDNYVQIIEERNLAAGIAESASYIASAILIYGVMQGSSYSFLLDISLTLFYFLLSQIALVLYSKYFITLRQKHWQFHNEIQAKNTAAALSFAFSLTSFALLIASYIALFDSIYGLFVSIFLAIALLFVFHFLVDKLFFPKVSLHEEIARDRNWGAACIEGSLVLSMSAVCVVAFSSYFS